MVRVGFPPFAESREELCARLFARWQAPPLFPEVRDALDGLSRPICLVSNIDTGDLQAALDYPLAFAALGLAGLVPVGVVQGAGGVARLTAAVLVGGAVAGRGASVK